MSRTIIAVVDDLFFASKIRGTAEALGVKVSFPRSLDSVIEAANLDREAVVICDLHATRIDPIELARRVKSDDSLRSISLIGFLSHVQTELKERAKEAGFDQVMPRSAFTNNLTQILSGQI